MWILLPSFVEAATVAMRLEALFAAPPSFCKPLARSQAMQAAIGPHSSLSEASAYACYHAAQVGLE
jgi:hypothetical protein